MSRDGISAFLLARIEEEEALAELAAPSRFGQRAPDGDEWSWDVLSIERDATTHQDRHVVQWWPGRVLAECAAKRAIIRQHEDWPVLVQQPLKIAPGDGGGPNSLVYQISQHMQWLTTREYMARFGTEPPAAPMLRALAAVYKGHPDYREEWSEA